jgi:hypothetical protein
VGITLSATNQYLDYDELDSLSGWEQLYLATTADIFSAGIEIPFPSPANTSIILAARATLYHWEHRLVGQPLDGEFEIQDSWSERRTENEEQVFLGARYLAPYAYAMVHPLWLFEMEVGGVAKTYGPEAFYYARGTVPIHGELTITARWQGEILVYDAHVVNDVDLPNGQTTSYAWGGRNGTINDGYAGLDFPLYKGYVGELPLFGLWNYVGGGLFGSYYRRSYYYQLADEGYSFPASEREKLIVGAKLTGLFHIMRRFPLAFSFQGGYDLKRHSEVYRFTTELAGIPSTVSLTPDFVPGLGNARRRGP